MSQTSDSINATVASLVAACQVNPTAPANISQLLTIAQLINEVDDNNVAALQAQLDAINPSAGNLLATILTRTPADLAAAGTNQSTAAQVVNDFTNVTGADGTKAAKLPVTSTGRALIITNNSNSAVLPLYPGTGGAINRGSINAAYSVPANTTLFVTGNSEATTDWSILTIGDVVTLTTLILTTLTVTTANVGSVKLSTPLVTTPVGTVSVAEYGDGKDLTTVLTLTNFIVGALAGSAAALGVGNIVAAFPAGQHFELVYSFSGIVLTAAGTAVATDTGLGSVVASGAVNVLSGTATFEDRLTGQTISTASGGGAAVSTIKAATAGIGTGISLNVAASVKNVFLNSAGDWNANNTGNLTATGVIVLKWTRMQ